ncbi:hypothetical protein R3P38DRAFT_3175557 [Favolaschia claudopus]|uniref:Uncharacterized protein n=1 Tax=Favolaschia claudopus TaxID=2862362 RepID=A0AAW0D5R2_9AGAR
MPDHRDRSVVIRGRLRTGIQSHTEPHVFSARLYSGTVRTTISVLAICAITPPLGNYPCIEAAMLFTGLQPWIHDVEAFIEHRSESGEVVTTKFVVFFQRHEKLPRNDTLNIQGELIVMRGGEDGAMVAEMTAAEMGLADQIAEALAPALRNFQTPERTNVKSILVISPDASE